MPQLNVKIDHVATLRQIRGNGQPEPAAAAVLAELGGADGISVHMWQDQRHTGERDVRILSQMVQTRLLLEITPVSELIGLALKVRPHRVNMVPENRDATAVANGLDLIINGDVVGEAVASLKRSGIETSVCIDPIPEQVKLAHRANVGMVEFHAGTYCNAKTTLQRNRAYMKILDAVNLARKLKLTVGIGHGLSYTSVQTFSNIAQLDEVTIGHSIVSRALLVGMQAAVSEMVQRMRMKA